MPTAIVQIRNADQRTGYHHAVQMVQLSGFYGIVRFNLPYAPVEIQYSDMSNKIEEYARPGDFSIIDSSGPGLMKVQMQFRYADPISSGNSSIESELNRLRIIGLDNSPVYFVNMDTYLSTPISPSFTGSRVNNIYLGSSSLALFRIADLGISVRRRNLQNQVTQADISLSLIEDRNPVVADVTLPSISYEDAYTSISAPPRLGGGGGSAPTGGGRKYSVVVPVRPPSTTFQ